MPVSEKLDQKRSLNFTLISASAVFFIVCAYVFFSAFANKLPMFDGAKFILFQVFGIIIPGLAVLSLLKLENLGIIQLIGFGYAFGFAVNIIEYLLLYPFGLKSFSIYLVAIVSIASIAVLIRTKKFFSTIKSDFKSSISILIIFLLYIFCIFFCYNLVNMIPSATGIVNYYPDLLYWVENSSALAKQFPPIDPRVAGFTYNYHFFSSMHIAFVGNIIKMPMLELSMCFSAITPAILCITGSYTLFKSLLKSRTLIIIGVFASLFTAGPYDNKAYNLFVSPFGTDYGYAFSMFFLGLIIMQFKQKKFQLKLLIPTFLCFAMAAGSKSPIALTFLAVLGFVCVAAIVKLIFSKKRKEEFKLTALKCSTYGLGCLVIFLIIYFSIVKMDYPAAFEPFNFIVGHAQFQSVYITLKEFFIPSIIAKIMANVLSLFYTNFFVFFIFFNALIYRVYRFKSTDLLDIGLFAGTFIGILFNMCFNMHGASQIYFLMGIYPIAILFAFYTFEKCHREKPIQKDLRAVAAVAAVFIIGIGAFRFFTPVVTKMKDGMRNLRLSLSSSQITVKNNDVYSLSSTEFMATEWIRVHTPENSVLITDRGTLSGESNVFATGAFTERQIYQESAYIWQDEAERERRVELMKKVYQGDSKAVIQAKSEGVDYIIQTCFITPEIDFSDGLVEVVFENSDMVVYKIK